MEAPEGNMDSRTSSSEPAGSAVPPLMSGHGAMSTSRVAILGGFQLRHEPEFILREDSYEVFLRQ